MIYKIVHLTSNGPYGWSESTKLKRFRKRLYKAMVAMMEGQ